MEFQEHSIGAGKLKTQCHSGPGLIAMRPLPSKIWILKGKVFPWEMERKFTPKDQKWRQLETTPSVLWDTVEQSWWGQSIIPIYQSERQLEAAKSREKLEQREIEVEIGMIIPTPLASFGSAYRDPTQRKVSRCLFGRWSPLTHYAQEEINKVFSPRTL